MPRTNPWKLPPGPERRERLRLLDVSITSEDYTPEELAALGMAPHEARPAASAAPGAAGEEQLDAPGMGSA
jgi:hypothetical protein